MVSVALAVTVCVEVRGRPAGKLGEGVRLSSSVGVGEDAVEVEVVVLLSGAEGPRVPTGKVGGMTGGVAEATAGVMVAAGGWAAGEAGAGVG
jgi:hypothetical protein